MEASVEELKSSYHTNPIFEFFTQEEFNQFLRMTDILIYEPDELIFERNQDPRGLYVIVEGKVKVSQTKEEGKAPRVLAELEAPTVLGEMALLEKRQRTSTATASIRTTALLLGKERFNDALHKNELMAFKLSHNLGKILTKKIVAMNKHMMEMKQSFKEFSNFKNSLFSDWNF